MKKLGTRLISAALAACMITSVLPVSAFASEGGTDEETGEDEEIEEELELDPYEHLWVYKPGTYTMKADTYNNYIFVEPAEGEPAINATVKVAGDVDVASFDDDEYGSWAFLDVYEADKLTINNSGHTMALSPDLQASLLMLETNATTAEVTVNGGIYRGYNSPVFYVGAGTLNLNGIAVKDDTEGAGTDNNAVNCQKGGTVHINGGSYYGDGKNPYNSGSTIPTFYNAGTMTVNGTTVHSDQGNAVCNEKGEVTLSGGEFTSAGAPTIYTKKDATTSIESGTYRRTGESGQVITNYGKLTIDQKGGNTLIENPEGTADTIFSSGDLQFNGGTVSAPNSSAIVCTDGTAQINGGTIKDSKYGINVQNAQNVTLKNVTFENNDCDIHLGTGQSITVDDGFTGRVTVEAEDPDAASKIITNNLQGAILISKNTGYRLDYEDDGYVLKARTPDTYLVDALNAKAEKEDGTILTPNTEIAVGEKVTLIANAPKEGEEFAGWELTGLSDADLTMPDENDRGTVTFTMPSADVTAKATYQPKMPDDSGDGSIDGAGSAGEVVAAVAIGTAAVWGAYEAGTGIYRAVNMKGISMPENRGELAVLLWEQAGRPEPESNALYADIGAADTALQKAARWCTEQGLLGEKADDGFRPDTRVTKLRVCTAWEQAKQKGLIQ